MNTKILCIAASMAVLSSTAFAASYVEVNLGASIPMDTKFKQDLSSDAKLSFKPTVAVTAALGYAFNNGLRTDLEYAYQGPDIDKLKGTIAGVPVTFNGDGSSLTVNTLLANVYYDFKNSTKFTPFIGGGLGVAFLGANTNGPDASQVRINTSGNDSVFAYQATVGGSYALTSQFSMTGSYRYLGTEEGSFNATAYAGLTPVATGTVKSSFSDNLIRLGVRYTF